MISDLFVGLENIVESFGSLLSSIFTGAIGLFYEEGSGLTAIGTLMLLGIGTGLLIWGFNFIRSLIRVRRG